MDESRVKLFLPKKRKCGANASNCFICKKKGTNMRKPGNAGKTSFINALTVRERCGGYNLIDLNEIIDYEQKSFKSPYEDQVRWHKECYSTYVSKSNLKHIRQEDNHDSELTSSSANNESMLTRSAIPAIDLKKKCMFCDKTNYKGNKTLIRIEYETFWKTLDKIAKEKNDHDLRRKVGGDFSKLPAMEARYHKNCHAAYTKHSVEKMTHKNHYDEAFSNFTPYLDDFRTIKLSSILTKYIDLLAESGLEKELLIIMLHNV